MVEAAKIPKRVDVSQEVKFQNQEAQPSSMDLDCKEATAYEKADPPLAQSTRTYGPRSSQRYALADLSGYTGNKKLQAFWFCFQHLLKLEYFTIYKHCRDIAYWKWHFE